MYECTSEQELRRRFDCNLHQQEVKKVYKGVYLRVEIEVQFCT